jgi:hypothetical protein
VVLPGLKNPPDPGPPRTFTPPTLPAPRSPSLPARAFQVSQPQRSAADLAGAAEASAKVQIVSSQRAPTALLDGALCARVGVLLDGLKRLPLRCSTTTLGNHGLRLQAYDRTALELSGGAHTGSGDREGLGTTASDIVGNDLLRFSRTNSNVGDESTNGIAASEDATVKVLPTLIVRVPAPCPRPRRPATSISSRATARSSASNCRFQAQQNNDFAAACRHSLAQDAAAMPVAAGASTQDRVCDTARPGLA